MFFARQTLNGAVFPERTSPPEEGLSQSHLARRSQCTHPDRRFEKRSGRSVQAAIFFHAGMNTFQSSSCYYQSVFALMFICPDLRW